MSHRFFKLQEAEQLLPVLEMLLNTAISNKKKLETLDAEFAGLSQRILVRGGILVDYGRMADLKLEKDNSVNELREALQQIESSGCLVKDLDIGLVDFPCLVNEHEIYLCWKLGEQHIGFWHHTDEGFTGRKPIDKEVMEGQDDPRRPN